jgi:hypothetical protein
LVVQTAIASSAASVRRASNGSRVAAFSSPPVSARRTIRNYDSIISRVALSQIAPSVFVHVQGNGDGLVCHDEPLGSDTSTRFYQAHGLSSAESSPMKVLSSELRRFESFLETLGRRLAKGQSFLREVSIDKLNDGFSGQADVTATPQLRSKEAQP